MRRISRGSSLINLVNQILEDILLRVAYQANIDEFLECGDKMAKKSEIGWHVQRGHPYRLEPTATLSRLSGVCRTFRATIEGSPKLQRGLTGSSETSLSPVRSLRCGPLKWLFEHAFGQRKLRNCNLSHLNLRSERVQIRSHLKKFLKGYQANLEASWRKVRARQTPGPWAFKVRITFQRPKGYKGRNSYQEVVEVGDVMTLGTVLANIERIFLRTGLEHLAWLESLDKSTSGQDETQRD